MNGLSLLAITLPQINATLNALCTVALVVGFIFIKTGRRKAHITTMIAALVLSVAFLSCYVYHHVTTQFVTEFPREFPVARKIYLAILIPHIILAMVIVPLVLRLVIAAARRKFEVHKRVARYTFPMWLFVSVTGVLVYFMLYEWYGPPSTKPKDESVRDSPAAVAGIEQRSYAANVEGDVVPAASGGALRFDSTTIEVDAKPEDDKVTGTWKVKNAGARPVNLVEFETSCHCLSVTQGGKVLQPGESTEVSAVFDIANMTGTAEKTVTVITDDPVTQAYRLTIRVNIPQVFVIEPNMVEWAVGAAPEAKSVSLKIAGGKPIRITEIQSSRKPVAAELEEVEPGREYRIKLTPSSTEESLLGMVKVTTDAASEKHRKTLFFFQISKP